MKRTWPLCARGGVTLTTLAKKHFNEEIKQESLCPTPGVLMHRPMHLAVKKSACWPYSPGLCTDGLPAPMGQSTPSALLSLAVAAFLPQGEESGTCTPSSGPSSGSLGPQN